MRLVICISVNTNVRHILQASIQSDREKKRRKTEIEEEEKLREDGDRQIMKRGE